MSVLPRHQRARTFWRERNSSRDLRLGVVLCERVVFFDWLIFRRRSVKVYKARVLDVLGFNVKL